MNDLNLTFKPRPYRFLYCLGVTVVSAVVFGPWVIVPLVLISIDLHVKTRKV